MPFSMKFTKKTNSKFINGVANSFNDNHTIIEADKNEGFRMNNLIITLFTHVSICWTCKNDI